MMLRTFHHSNVSQVPQENLSGTVERITFHSEETGFCVLRVQVKGFRELVPVTGIAMVVSAGETIEARGSWVNDKTHGRQFKAEQLRVIPPSTLEGIEKYLGSGLVKGIGPHFAKILVEGFGEAVFDVIEQTPEALLTLSGIGKKRKEKILSGWAEQKAIRAIMVFLQSHGVGSSRAVRIYKTYGDAAIDKVRENPYRLSLDVHGIGFKTADTIAQKLGVPRDSPLRALAGVRHVLQNASSEGHCGALQNRLQKEAIELLGVSEPLIVNAIEEGVNSKEFVRETLEDEIEPAIFLGPLYQAEASVAKRLRYLLAGSFPWGHIESAQTIPWVEARTQLKLSDSQRQAVERALCSKVLVITGGPGVGKTTVVNSLLKILTAKNMRVELCAPTGRAAKRLTETTGLPAKTIHRLLEFNPKTFGFKHGVENPLSLDLLIVDEASMLDIILMNHLLKAIPPEAALFLIGDVDQLPSVGPGSVLKDIIASSLIPTVFLTQIFRQAESSQIIVNAHRINQGKIPLKLTSQTPEALTDFYFIPTESPEATHDKILELVAERIPERFKFHPLKDIQVLTPMNRGGVGARSLNVALQEKLNGRAHPKISRFGSNFASGDKVIQLVNNYDKDVFNGDIGQVVSIDIEESFLALQFDDRLVNYDFNELDEVTLAYATSIHKAQGSEYPVVVIPISMQHYRMLARNLLYTGVTRGKQLVVLVGEPKALAIAVGTADSHKRLTRLKRCLTL